MEAVPGGLFLNISPSDPVQSSFTITNKILTPSEPRRSPDNNCTCTWCYYSLVLNMYYVLVLFSVIRKLSLNGKVGTESAFHMRTLRPECALLVLVSRSLAGKNCVHSYKQSKWLALNLTEKLSSPSFLPSPFLTCCAILPTSFGGKGPHLRRWLVEQLHQTVS